MEKPASPSKHATVKNIDQYHYMKVKLEFEDSDVQLTAAEFKHLLIAEAIGTLYGSIGTAIHLDVLYYCEENCEAVLRIKTRDYQKVWAALTLLAHYNKQRCVVRVMKVTGHLLGINHSRSSETYTDLITD